MKIILISLIAVFLLFGCKENSTKEGDTKKPSGMTMGINSGVIHYTAATPCKAGDYSSFPTGIKNITIECDHDGKLSKIIMYSVFFSQNYNNPVKSYETNYRGNGTRKTQISYYSDGTKSYESTYYKDGERKTYIDYNSDGTVRSGYPKCYDTDGTTTETCAQDEHGCTSTSTTCITE